MDEKMPATPGPTHREDSFDVAVRGYNRQQVMDYMTRAGQLQVALEQQLAAARSDVQRARAEAEQAQAETTALRARAAESKPVHEEVSGRLSQILRLAAEEADQERATAEDEIAVLRAQTKADVEQLLAQAHAQAEDELARAHTHAEGELAQAHAQSEREKAQAHAQAESEKTQAHTQAESELAQAHTQAESELAQAHAQAEREVASARASADAELTTARDEAASTLANARDEADRLRLASVRQTQELLDEAQRRAGAVNEVSNQRLETLTATHGEAVLRLGQIRDVLADLLERDDAAGSLAEVVEAVVSPPKAATAQPDADQPAVDRPAAGPDVEGSAADAELDAEDDEHSPAHAARTPVPENDLDLREPRVLEDHDPVSSAGVRAQQVLPRR